MLGAASGAGLEKRTTSLVTLRVTLMSLVILGTLTCAALFLTDFREKERLLTVY